MISTNGSVAQDPELDSQEEDQYWSEDPQAAAAATPPPDESAKAGLAALIRSGANGDQIRKAAAVVGVDGEALARGAARDQLKAAVAKRAPRSYLKTIGAHYGFDVEPLLDKLPKDYDRQRTAADYAKGLPFEFTGGFNRTLGAGLEGVTLLAKGINAPFVGKDAAQKDYEQSYAHRLAQKLRGPTMAPKTEVSGTVAADVAQGLGSSLAMAGTAAATGPAGVAPELGIAGTGILQGVTQGYEDAKAKGATEGQAWASALLNGGIGASEALPLGGILERAMKGPGGEVLKHMLVEATEEFAQEAGQQLAGNIIAKATVGYDKDRALLESMWRNGRAGFLTGAIASALGSSLGPRAEGVATGQEGGADTTGSQADPTGSAGKAPGTAPDAERISAGEPSDPLTPANARSEPVATAEGSTEAQPEAPRGTGDLDLPAPITPTEVRNRLEALAQQPQLLTDHIGGDRIRVHKIARKLLTMEPGEMAAKLEEAYDPASPDADLVDALHEIVTGNGLDVPAEAVLPAGDTERGGSPQPEPSPAPADTTSPPEAAAPPSTEEAAPEEPSTGVKNATVDAELAAMGFEPAQHGESVTFADQHEQAKAKLAADPFAGAKLVDRLAESPRPHTKEEAALLALEVNRLIVARDEAQADFVADPTEDNRARIDQVKEAYARAADVVTQAGTETAQGLAFRRMMIKRDYSLAAMERNIEVAQNGEPLSKEQSARVAELHGQLQAALKAHEDYKAAAIAKQAELEAENATLRLKKEVRARQGNRAAKIAQSRAKIDALFGELVAQSKRARTGLDVDTLATATKLAAEHIKIGYHQFAGFAEEMVARAGEAIRPYLQQAWDKAREAYRAELAAPIAERIKAGEKIGELGRYVNKIAESLVADGIETREELETAIHEVLKPLVPGLTRAQARDALSGYGQFTPLSQDAVKAKLRDLKGQMQQVAKLEEMQAGKAPKKTGPERRAPSDAERRLIQQVNEAKKSLGITTATPEQSLKSALDSIKTRLRNQISDLQHQIDTGQRVERTDRPSPSDAEAVALQKQRDALKAQFDEVFTEKKPADAAQVTALQRQITALSDQIARGEIQRVGPKQGPDTKAVAELKQKRAALQDRLAEMRKPAPATQAEKDAAKVAAASKAIQKSIAEYTRRIAAGETAAKARKPGPSSPELEAMRARRDALAEELQELRDAASPKATPEMRALQAYKTRTKNEIARIQERMFYGEFGAAKKPAPLVLDQEGLKLQADIEEVKRRYAREAERARLRKRTKGERAVDAAKEVLDLPRAVLTGYDLSAVLKQGGVLSLDPWNWGKLTTDWIPNMLRAAASERVALEIDTALRSRALASFGDASHLDLTRHGDDVGKHEEAIRSRWSDKIPLMKASNRAFVTFLNIQRAAAFDNYVRAYPGTPTAEIGKQLASAVNIFTGRGELGKYGSPVNTIVSGTEKLRLLWAPRLLLSRMQLLALQPLHRGDFTARKLIAKQYARTLIGVATVYALSKLAGGDVGDDRRSADWGKILVGNTRIDPLTGLSQITVLLTRLGTGETRTAEGQVKELKGTNSRKVVAERFLRSKLSPLVGLTWDLLEGKDFKGDPVTAPAVAERMLVPMSFQDIYEAMQEQGIPAGAALGILSVFGAGLQTYGDKRTPAPAPAPQLLEARK